MDYKDFKNELLNYLEADSKFYQKLMSNIIFYPEKFYSNFRLTGIKDRIRQVINQNYEIRFIKFFDDYIVKILDENGYKYNDYFGKSTLKLFEKDDYIYLIDFRMRDDHGYSQKMNMISRIVESGKEVSKIYPNRKLKCAFWFIDEFGARKNEVEMWENFAEDYESVAKFYGNQLFMEFHLSEIWFQIIENLELLKSDEYFNKNLHIPDFNNSKLILDVLLKMPGRPWNRLNFEPEGEDYDDKFLLLNKIKKEIFGKDGNLDKAKIIRNKKSA